MGKKIKLKGQTSIEVLAILGVLIIGGIILGSFYLNSINDKTQEATDISSTSSTLTDFLNETGEVGTPNYNNDIQCDSDDDCSTYESNDCIEDLCTESGSCGGELLNSGNCTTSLGHSGICSNGTCISETTECNPVGVSDQCGETDNECTIYECSDEGTCVEKNYPDNYACTDGICIDGVCSENYECGVTADCLTLNGVPSTCHKWSCDSGNCEELKYPDETNCITNSDPSEDGYCLGGDCRSFEKTCQEDSDCQDFLGSSLGSCQEEYCKIKSGYTTGFCTIINTTEICCGNGTCETGEDYSSCSADCSCGDGVCDDLELANGSCSDDCGLEFCEGITSLECNSSENTCSLCYNDPNAPNCSPCCGDGTCDSGEELTCSTDCSGGIFGFEINVNPTSSSALPNNNFLITVNGEETDSYDLELDVTLNNYATSNCCLVGSNCSSSYSWDDVSLGDHTYQFNCNSEGTYQFKFTGIPVVGDSDVGISTWNITSSAIIPNYALCKTVINSNGTFNVCINKLEGENTSSYGSLKVYVNQPDVYENNSTSPSCVTNTNGNLCIYIGKITP